jgi:hypothetical protein
MTRTSLLQVGAVAAIAGVLLTVVAVVTEPAVPGAAAEQMRLIADNGYFTANRLIDMVGTALILLALAIVARTFRGGPAEDWSRVGLVFLATGIAIGMIANVLGVAVFRASEVGIAAVPADQAGYVAAIDTLGYSIAAIFAAAFLIISLYLATLSASILSSHIYPHWIGWFAGVAAVLMFTGTLGSLFVEGLFMLALLGFLLWLIATLALGVKLWQKSGAMMADSTVDLPPAPATGVAP